MIHPNSHKSLQSRRHFTNMTNTFINMKLESIAEVRSGLVLSRKQARESSDFKYALLNLRSIHVNGHIDLKQLGVFYATESLSACYLSQVGDVIIRLSAPYTAVLIDEATAGMVVSSNLVIIRVDRRELLPEYLFWLLNTPKVKRSIYENTSSNMLGAINAKYFSDFDIPALPLPKQQKIADMNALALKEATLLRRLAEQKERYYSFMINRIQKVEEENLL